MVEPASGDGVGPPASEELLWTPKNRAALHQLAASPLPPQTRIGRLAKPKRVQLTRKLVKLHVQNMGNVKGSLPQAPSIDPQARFLAGTFASSRRTLPRSGFEPTMQASSISRLGLPLEAAVPWRSPRSPPWARRSLARDFELAKQSEPAVQTPFSLVPSTLLRHPKWNSSQLGVYQDWPKGLLLPHEPGKTGLMKAGRRTVPKKATVVVRLEAERMVAAAIMAAETAAAEAWAANGWAEAERLEAEQHVLDIVTQYALSQRNAYRRAAETAAAGARLEAEAEGMAEPEQGEQAAVDAAAAAAAAEATRVNAARVPVTDPQPPPIPDTPLRLEEAEQAAADPRPPSLHSLPPSWSQSFRRYIDAVRVVT